MTHANTSAKHYSRTARALEGGHTLTREEYERLSARLRHEQKRARVRADHEARGFVRGARVA